MPPGTLFQSICVGAGEKVQHPVLFDLSASQNVLWIEDPDKMICSETVKTAWVFVEKQLKNLGFPQPVFVEKTGTLGWAQECPADPAMAAICQQTKNGYVIALERGNDAGEAISSVGRMALNAGRKGVESIRKSNKEWWTSADSCIGT
jgi:hypothetical protein